MTNAEIIFQNRVFLMEEGVIRGTDEIITIKDDKGERQIQMPEEIRTFDEWKRKGYIVQKGEHSVARFKIWMPKKGKAKVEEDEQKDEKVPKGFYLKTAFFFTENQVKRMEGK